MYQLRRKPFDREGRVELAAGAPGENMERREFSLADLHRDERSYLGFLITIVLKQPNRRVVGKSWTSPSISRCPVTPSCEQHNCDRHPFQSASTRKEHVVNHPRNQPYDEGSSQARLDRSPSCGVLSRFGSLCCRVAARQKQHFSPDNYQECHSEFPYRDTAIKADVWLTNRPEPLLRSIRTPPSPW